MKVGRTIAEERERLESESERIAAREKVKSRQKYVVIFYVLAVAIIAVLISNGVKSLIEHVDNNNVEVKTVEPKAEIIDESGAGIPKRTKECIAKPAAGGIGRMMRVSIFIAVSCPSPFPHRSAPRLRPHTRHRSPARDERPAGSRRHPPRRTARTSQGWARRWPSPMHRPRFREAPVPQRQRW